jgi:hypothetical protein
MMLGMSTLFLFVENILMHCACSMPLPETVETYKYFITEAEKLDLAYIALVRYSTLYDPKFDGRCLSFFSHQLEIGH